MVKELNEEFFDQYFKYDPECPSGLRWKVDRYGGKNYKVIVIKAGTVAGGIQKDSRESDYKFWAVKLDGTLYQIHRVIYCMHHGDLSTEYNIDHIDGNSLNNNITNLRAVTQAHNCRNSKKPVNNTSGVMGVKIQTDKRTGHVCIRAFWTENFKGKTKNFSVSKYGYELAFELACKHRKEAIDRLNEQGAGYSERHGQDE